jgi:hypothetical protein
MKLRARPISRGGLAAFGVFLLLVADVTSAAVQYSVLGNIQRTS